MIKIGILSDTHLSGPNELFKKHAQACFSDVDIIFHAGDLTELTILSVFNGKELHAVHGNMCGYSAYNALPEKKVIQAGNFTIALTHGADCGYNDIEECLWNEFAPIDCIVYGHTHQPVCHKKGPILFINPGSFSLRTRYGTVGTYAILEVGEKLHGEIHELESIP